MFFQQELAVEDLIKLVPGYSPQFEEVLRGCLQSHPEDRLTPMELLELEWFRQFRRPAGQADEDEAVGRRQGSCVDSGEQDGAHRAAKYGDEGALEVGQKDDAGGRESNDGGNETHVRRAFSCVVGQSTALRFVPVGEKKKRGKYTCK